MAEADRTERDVERALQAPTGSGASQRGGSTADPLLRLVVPGREAACHYSEEVLGV